MNLAEVGQGLHVRPATVLQRVDVLLHVIATLSAQVRTLAMVLPTRTASRSPFQSASARSKPGVSSPSTGATRQDGVACSRKRRKIRSPTGGTARKGTVAQKGDCIIAARVGCLSMRPCFNEHYLGQASDGALWALCSTGVRPWVTAVSPSCCREARRAPLRRKRC